MPKLPWRVQETSEEAFQRRTTMDRQNRILGEKADVKGGYAVNVDVNHPVQEQQQQQPGGRLSVVRIAVRRGSFFSIVQRQRRVSFWRNGMVPTLAIRLLRTTR